MEKFIAQEGSITLEKGTIDEIAQALKELGASQTTIAKARASFDFAKIPGAQVSRVEGGFQVGRSHIPESQSTTKLIEGTQGKFAALIAKSAKIAANDERFAIAA